MQIIAAFSKTQKSQSNLMREFGVGAAHKHFESLKNPNLYDRKQRVDLITKIRPYTLNLAEKDLKQSSRLYIS
jgi:hypothetical protein